MTRIFKKITALAMAAVTAGALGLGAAAEAVETVPETALPEVYCPVNDDPEFPFNIELDIAENSVRYIDLDEPVYGFESILDEEALDFKMNVSLKDEFKDFESYKFELFTSDYSDKLFSQSAGNGETITVPDMLTAKGYKLSATLKSDSLTADYGGQFSIQVELDSTVVVDLFYQLAGMEGSAAPYVNEVQENDAANNNIETPDYLGYAGIDASIMTGDVDYFKYKVPEWIGDDGEEVIDRGVANITFCFKTKGWNIPNCTVEITEENGNPVKSLQFDAILRTSYYVRIPNAPLQGSYIIKIMGEKDLKAQYTLTPSCNFGQAWFGQYSSKEPDAEASATIKDSMIEYWNANKLDTIEQYSAKNDTYYPVLLESYPPTSNNDDVFATACGVVSSAMIFRNLGATMTGYDYRTGQSGEFQADPFTALLSNCGYDGYELLSMTKSPNNPNRYLWPNDPDNKEDDYPDAWNEGIGNKFGLSYVKIDKTESSIRNAIGAHGYVLVYFDENTEKQHFMVMTRLDYGSGDLCDKAYVLDPAATTYSAGTGYKGNGILLSQTTSGHSNAKMANISSVGYFA